MAHLKDRGFLTIRIYVLIFLYIDFDSRAWTKWSNMTTCDDLHIKILELAD